MAIVNKTHSSMAMLKLIHKGESTHSQLQSMLPVSFRPMNKTVNSPLNPIPLELLVDLVLILVFLLSVYATIIQPVLPAVNLFHLH
jgi:hypothetical protein